MGIEIERKYLVNRKKWNESGKGRRRFYQQGYLLTDPSKTIRMRLSDSDGFLTIKGSTVGASRLEYEYAIPRQEAKELLDRFCSAVITKYRYEVPVGDRLWEVDEFLDANEGLLIAEIELSSEEEAFELPEWVDTDVTSEEKYYNAYLASHPYKSWNV